MIDVEALKWQIVKLIQLFTTTRSPMNASL
jgi:hypothetical protein